MLYGLAAVTVIFLVPWGIGRAVSGLAGHHDDTSVEAWFVGSILLLVPAAALLVVYALGLAVQSLLAAP